MGFYLKSYHEFKNVADYVQYGRLDEVCGPKASIDRESQKHSDNAKRGIQYQMIIAVETKRR